MVAAACSQPSIEQRLHAVESTMAATYSLPCIEEQLRAAASAKAVMAEAMEWLDGQITAQAVALGHQASLITFIEGKLRTLRHASEARWAAVALAVS